MRHAGLRVAFAALAIVGAGCSGEVASQSGGSSPARPGAQATKPGAVSGTGGAGAPAAMPGGGPSAGPNGLAPATAAMCAGRPLDPGPVYLRRLTNAEYRQTVRDLLGDGPDRGANLPTDAVHDGFDNNAEAIAISNVHIEKYREAAEQIAADVLADAARRDRVVACSLAANKTGCLAQFIASFGRKAYRRPLAPEEIAALTTLGNTAISDADPNGAVALVIQGVLLSPSFLWRVEVGKADPAKPNLLKVTGHEMATRLSYWLRGTTPDEALLQAADMGKLDTSEGVAAVADGLIADARIKPAMRTFFGNWLMFPVLSSVTRSATKYPMWNETLSAAMKDETARLIEDFAWKDGGNFLDAFTAQYTYADARNAKLYPGKPAGAGATMARVDFQPADGRSGLLTQPSVLTATGKSDSGLAIFRGKFIREQLLCERLPSPPDSVPSIPAARPGQSDQQRLEQHRKDPACGGCHALMDPAGFGLSRFDLVGMLRTADSAGQPVSAQGSLTGFGAPEFDGAAQLGQALVKSPRLPSCLSMQMFRFTYGRKEIDSDACQIASAEAAFKAAGNSFKGLLLAFVRSDAFRYRRSHAANVVQ